MAAPTHRYCNYGAGNDYAGASFVDGAFTVADMTLTKTGAFSAAKANHWLYLTDNGSGRVTAGYYKIASVTSANAVVLATSPKSGATDPVDVKCTQATGTAALPFRSIQGALDLKTRDATNGDQVNVASATAQVLQASISLTTYGTPAESAPVIFRGYTTSANDGGMAEIDCNGVTMFAAAYNNLVCGWLACHSFGDNNGIVLGATETLLVRCEVHKGASTPSGKYLVQGPALVGCYIHDAGSAGTGAYACTRAIGNYAYNCPTGLYRISVIVNNIVHNCDTYGIQFYGDDGLVMGNTVYTANNATGVGIGSASSTYANWTVINNVVEGYSGTGGKSLATAGDAMLAGYNAHYNNAAVPAYGDVFVDLQNDQALAASPFVSPGTGNFAVGTNVKSLGWPGAWFGTATKAYVDIGAVQRQEAGVAGAILSRIFTGF